LKQENKGFWRKIPSRGIFLATTESEAKNGQFIDLYKNKTGNKKKGRGSLPALL